MAQRQVQRRGVLTLAKIFGNLKTLYQKLHQSMSYESFADLNKFSQGAYTPRGDEPQSFGTSTPWLGVDGSNSSHSVPVSRLGNNLNVLEDISWEHKDVYHGTKSAEVTITSPVDSLKSFGIELKLEDLVQFYCNLKDDL